jgi:hypothetical protein
MSIVIDVNTGVTLCTLCVLCTGVSTTAIAHTEARALHDRATACFCNVEQIIELLLYYAHY